MFRVLARKNKKADWKRPEDIFVLFPAADLLGNGTNRIVFDVGGNRYRIICKYGFGLSVVNLWICWIGTHSHYSKICSENRQFTIHQY
jgi:mRNA interferase HigB